ncbi:uncharacterized protein LOC144385279 [Gasterosteus aculeatus]
MGDFLSRQREILLEKPLLSNVIVGVILTILEKLMEREFQCPCNFLRCNIIFSLAFFIIPAIMAFTLMLIIQGCTHIDVHKCRKTVISFVSAIVWLLLLLFDGQYLACAMTDWKGTFVIVDKEAKMKWCESNVNSTQRMETTHWNYVISQVIGLVLLLFICGGLITYQLHLYFKVPQSATPQPENLQVEVVSMILLSETPQPETPQPADPQPETPQSETPQPETPQPADPQPETPQSETPQSETPQPETPQPADPQPETPQSETPQSETPQSEPQPGNDIELINM